MCLKSKIIKVQVCSEVSTYFTKVDKGLSLGGASMCKEQYVQVDDGVMCFQILKIFLRKVLNLLV